MRKRGFTLIELLVVVAILALLMGLLVPMMTVARRSAKVANTRAIMMKVDQAVRLFRNDMKVYPVDSGLADAHADPAKWTNNLAVRLGWAATSAESDAYAANYQADLSAIAARFQFVNGRSIGLANGDGTHVFRADDPRDPAIKDTYRTNILLWGGSLKRIDSEFTNLDGGAQNSMPGGGDAQASAEILTRLAMEISMLRYVAGQLPVEAPQGIDPALPADKAANPDEDQRYPLIYYRYWNGLTRTGYRYLPYNKAGHFGDDSRGPVLTIAAALAKGWNGDYLVNAFKARSGPNGAGEIAENRETYLDAFGNPLIYVCRVFPGARGVQHGLNGDSIREVRYGMAPSGRLATSFLASDIRTTAAGHMTMEFELWSAGPDGRFSETRGDQANADNIALLPYQRGMQ